MHWNLYALYKAYNSAFLASIRNGARARLDAHSETYASPYCLIVMVIGRQLDS